MADVTVRSLGDADRAWAEGFLAEQLGGRRQARRGEVVDALAVAGLVAEHDGEAVGLLMYDRRGDDVEVVALAAAPRGGGAGTALLDALRSAVPGARRAWLVTTNDNVDALRFYQRRGFRLVALTPGAVDDARRRLKPEIPPLGEHGIPRRDELELERPLP